MEKKKRPAYRKEGLRREREREIKAGGANPYIKAGVKFKKGDGRFFSLCFSFFLCRGGGNAM